jgi:hypothetical protein
MVYIDFFERLIFAELEHCNETVMDKIIIICENVWVAK